MKDGKLVIAVDFDGTICEHKFPEIGEMKAHADTVLRSLDKAGCKIIIHTVRVNPDINKEADKYVKEMEEWLKEKNIPYDEVWKNVGKPYCHFFIDDRAITFTNWPHMLATILQLFGVMSSGEKGAVN